MDEKDVGAWLEQDRTTSIALPEGHLCLGIESRASGKLIGFLDLSADGQHIDQVGFSLMINPSFRGNGYGTEAVRFALVFACNTLEVRRIATCVDSRNGAAQHCLERAGMRREGVFMKDWFLNGEWVNSVWYAFLADDLH